MEKYTTEHYSALLSCLFLQLADPLEDFLLTLTGSDDPIALGGLTTDHEPSTLTRTVSATEGKWNEAGRLYEEADAPIPTMEGAACMVRVEDTIYEIGADSVATYDLTFNVRKLCFLYNFICIL